MLQEQLETDFFLDCRLAAIAGSRKKYPMDFLSERQ
jgi:hypothetical protein